MDENYQREEKLWEAIEALNKASQDKPYANTLTLIAHLISTNVDDETLEKIITGIKERTGQLETNA
jgi:hypothetical protein